MMVMLNTNGVLSVTDYYSTAFVKPTKVLPVNLILTSSVANSTGIYGKFTRPLDIPSSSNEKIFVGLSTDFSFAYLTPPDQGFVHHNNQGVGSITFGETKSTSEWVPNGNSTDLPYVNLDSNFKMGWEFSDSDISFTFNVSII